MICYCSHCPIGPGNPIETIERQKKYGPCPIKDPSKAKYRQKWRKCKFQRAWLKAMVDYRYLSEEDLDVNLI